MLVKLTKFLLQQSLTKTQPPHQHLIRLQRAAATVERSQTAALLDLQVLQASLVKQARTVRMDKMASLVKMVVTTQGRNQTIRNAFRALSVLQDSLDPTGDLVSLDPMETRVRQVKEEMTVSPVSKDHPEIRVSPDKMEQTVNLDSLDRTESEDAANLEHLDNKDLKGHLEKMVKMDWREILVHLDSKDLKDHLEMMAALVKMVLQVVPEALVCRDPTLRTVRVLRELFNHQLTLLWRVQAVGDTDTGSSIDLLDCILRINMFTNYGCSHTHFKHNTNKRKLE